MKIDRSKNPLVFEITVENEKELDALASLFNCAPICEAYKELCGEDMDFCGLLDEDNHIGDKTTEFLNHFMSTAWAGSSACRGMIEKHNPQFFDSPNSQTRMQDNF